MSGQNAAFVGNIPETYDRGLGPIIFVDYADDIARRAAALHPGRVLETAAGTGIVTRRLRDLLPADTSLTATDLNPPMVEIARTKFRDGETIDFKQADATSLPFSDGSFDLVVCQFGLMFFPDKDKSYREVHRVLAPGGHYLFNVWESHKYIGFGRIAHETVTRLFPDNPPGFYRVPFSCHQIDPIKESLLAAGFTGITISVVNQEKQIPDLTAFAHAIVFGNPLADQVRQQGGDPQRVMDEILEGLRREYEPRGGRLALQAIVFQARKP